MQVPLYPESSVQVKLDSTKVSEWHGDLLAIGLYEDDISSSEGMDPPSTLPRLSPCALACSNPCDVLYLAMLYAFLHSSNTLSVL